MITNHITSNVAVEHADELPSASRGGPDRVAADRHDVVLTAPRQQLSTCANQGSAPSAGNLRQRRRRLPIIARGIAGLESFYADGQH